ncbi:unnamed protein product [Prorocentrum cordatum]|uniref:Reverse transcriptase Ty1/copia-type domain-containing protein n=1 Tax=Prorocentrum cordatum TaxID=2364126 RepID=A0ABN9TN62_9DINO|nr:unnamed protein product [Polarella glacialis]
MEDPKIFRRYKAQVENWVLIAKNIIGPEEMAPRLYAALRDKAFDHVEGESPAVFAVPNGVELLLDRLAYFDQRPTVKIGAAMDDFFHMEHVEPGETLLQLATRVDKAVLQARSVDLAIPDPIIIRQFMKSSQLDHKTQATLLMAAGSKFEWKPLKEQAAILFPMPLVPRNRFQGDRKYRPQYSAHVTNQDTYEREVTEPDYQHDHEDWQVTDADFGHDDSYDNSWEEDSGDFWDEQLPEALAREIHTARVTFKQAHDLLNQANRARGYYNTKGSKGKGKHGKGYQPNRSGKGKGNDGGKARRGMSLEDLKKVTNCSACGEIGHWAACESRITSHYLSAIVGQLTSPIETTEINTKYIIPIEPTENTTTYLIPIESNDSTENYDTASPNPIEQYLSYVETSPIRSTSSMSISETTIGARVRGDLREYARYKVIDSFLSKQFPAMQILCQDKTVDSFIPDTRTGSRTKMSCYPDLNKTCCHPTNGEHEYTVPAGRFKECLYCGTVWKGEKYQIRAKDVIFWNLHGTRETPGGSQLTTGQAKRYYGMANSVYNNLQLEKRVYERRMQKSRFPRRQRRGFDIYEIFAGECGIALHATDRANGWGMRALQPVDKLFGQDLKKQKARKEVLDTIDRWRPRLVIIQLPCTLWSLLNRNVNYKEMPEVLEDLRDEERCFITFTKDIFDQQKDYGNHALLENPATADSWREEAIVKLRQDNYECTSNMCMFGMVGNQGLPMKKLVRWLGTRPLLIQELDRHCDHSHPHEEVQGGGPNGNTKLSQVYTWQLADAICRGLTRVIESEEFGHGIYLCSYYPVSYDAPAPTVHHVCYSAPDMDETKWKNIMQSVVDVMSRRNAPSAQVAQDSEMRRQVSELVPWQILYMQAAFQPPTHHENDFKTQYDTVCSLSDVLQSAKYQHHLDHQSKANHDSQYQYPTNHSQTNFSLSLSNNGLATMHQNLSHPLQADFTRFLNASDASQAHDFHVEKPPAEAHWQSGRVEANITLWKHMAKKVIDTMQLAGVEDMKLMAPAINQSRNSRVRQCGDSPYQWTFGKDPRIPDSITDPANSAVVHSAMTADAELAKRARVRALADMAFTEYDRSESLKRAMFRVYLNSNGSFTMTKKDQKALIREIPYSQIPADQLPLFREALAREWPSWQRFSAVEVLDLKTSKSIESDPENNKRIIPSRVCYRDKNAGRGVSEIDAKARIVGIGYNDPDIMTLRRDAPTLTRAGFYILRRTISSWDFNLFGGDVTTAFLQADQTKAQRDKPIYLRQPSEGLPGVQRGALLLVRRAIYGFVNSPRLWWRELRDFLMHIGGKQCLLDKALFCFYNKSHRIIMIIGIPVDDLIGGADAREGSKLLETIRHRFTFGKWWDNKLTYCGKRLSKNENGTIFINQKEL